MLDDHHLVQISKKKIFFFKTLISTSVYNILS
jgi:hypothetical protein